MNDSLKVSVIIPARHAGSFIEASVARLVEFLGSRFVEGSFEIIVVPNKRVSEPWDTTLEVAKALPSKWPCVRVVPLASALGKGSAIRYGFFAAQGEWIFLTDADLPYDLSFFDQAILELKQGVHFVAGNRRLSDSRFDSPVSLLHLVYRRHRLGVNFNRLVRCFLGINSLDTQCGIKAMEYPLARKIFLGQTCPGFLADIEYFLIQSENQYKLKELPVRLILRDEKSTVRLFRETLAIAWWLPKLCFQKWLGCYRYPETSGIAPTKITADDWGMSPGVNDGIIHLARLGIVRRVSILAQAPYCSYRLEELKAIQGLELGLHLDFSSEWATYRLSLGRLLDMCFGRCGEWVSRECRSQVSRLVAAGVYPHYLDGHHHVHVFPGMARPLASLMKELNIKAVRIPVDSSDYSLRGLVLRIFGTFARKAYLCSGITALPFFYPHASHFAGGFNLVSKMATHSGFEIPVHPAAYDDFDELKYRDSYRGRVWEWGVLRALFQN